MDTATRPAPPGRSRAEVDVKERESGTESVIIGIDLGTTMSAAAIVQGASIELIPNALGELLTPSAVAVDGRSGSTVVGRTAKDLLAATPSCGAFNFKRLMGRDDELPIGERRFTPVELSAYVLDTLRADAERWLGTRVDRCVVTVPAYFSEAQRAATRAAARLAGFTVERILNEPTAAALAYGLHAKTDESQFLVFDLGGGTFDVCVMELFEGTLQVRSVAGESSLGGEDFTAALVDMVLAQVDATRAQLLGQPELALTLHRRCELLKRKLARWPRAHIEVPAFEGGPERATAIEISREQAERAYKPLFDRMVGPCRAALRGAEITAEDLDEVILVGGATRMPAVAAFVESLFGRAPLIDTEPDRVVARGAALQAALIARDTAIDDMVVTDVASHSLGVEVTRDIGGRHVSGYFSPIIHRNTVIPTARTERYSTLERNQTQITLVVYEGEARRVRDNVKLGEVEVSGIPRGPAGQSVDVTFTFDLDGILGVSAEVIDTGQRFEAVFSRSGEELAGERLERARERMSSLRSEPGERPRYRDLLARAELLWGEIPADERRELEAHIQLFERALADRDPDAIEAAYAALHELCESLDEGERW